KDTKDTKIFYSFFVSFVSLWFSSSLAAAKILFEFAFAFPLGLQALAIPIIELPAVTVARIMPVSIEIWIVVIVIPGTARADYCIAVPFEQELCAIETENPLAYNAGMIAADRFRALRTKSV